MQFSQEEGIRCAQPQRPWGPRGRALKEASVGAGKGTPSVPTGPPRPLPGPPGPAPPPPPPPHPAPIAWSLEPWPDLDGCPPGSPTPQEKARATGRHSKWEPHVPPGGAIGTGQPGGVLGAGREGGGELGPDLQALAPATLGSLVISLLPPACLS